MDGELFGFMSALCLSICGIPQAYKCFKTGRAKDLSGLFLFTWFAGKLFLILYAVYLGWVLPLLLDASTSLVVVTIILKYYLYPRRSV